MTEDDLLDEIAAAPDEVGPYLICADLLQQRGDPRGDLIVVQHALEVAPDDVALRRRESELIREHRDAWFGVGKHAGYMEVVYRRGFVHAVRLLVGADEHTLEALLETPHVESTLAELRISNEIGPDLHSILALLGRRWPRSLRRLHVAADDAFLPQSLPSYSLAPIGDAAIRLETLVVGGVQVELGRAPRFVESLRRFEARTREPIAAQVGAHACWPALEHLGIRHEGAFVLALLTGERFPRLRSVALPATRGTAALCVAIAGCNIAAQLEALDVSGGDLESSAEVERLPSRIALDLRRNLMSAAVVELSARAALVHPQREEARPLGVDGVGRVLSEAMTEAWNADASEARVHHGRVIELAERHGALPFVEDWRTRFASRLPPVEARAELDAVAAAQAERVERVAALAIAEALSELGEVPAAEAWLLRAVTQAQLHRDPTSEGQAMHALAKLEQTRADLAAAEMSLRAALEIARSARNAGAEAYALSELAGFSRDRGDLESAARLFEAAIDTRGDDVLADAADRTELAAVLLDAGRLNEAGDAAFAAYEAYRDHDEVAGMARAEALVGEVARSSGNLVDARPWLDSALALSREGRTALGERYVLIYLARLSNDAGLHIVARGHAYKAIAIAQASPFDAGVQLLALADAQLGDKQYADARRTADRALATLAGHWKALARLRKGIAAQLDRADGEAQRHYDEALRDAGRHADTVAWIELWLATLQARAYRANDAFALLERAAGRFPTTTHRTNDAVVMADAILKHHGGTIGGVRAGVPGYVMATAMMDKVQGHRTPLPEPTTFETRLLVRLGAS